MRAVKWTEDEIRRRAPAVESGCWEWTMALGVHGYGTTRFRRKTVAAHRVSWTVFRGEIPDGLCVLHRCDNRKCLNPDHLFLGTQYDNNADRDAKGRHRPLRGKDNGHATTLDEEGVALIRQMWRYGFDQDTIGGLFGIAQAYVSHVITKKVWAHVP